MKTILFVFLLAMSSLVGAQETTMRDYVARLADKVLLLELRLKTAEEDLRRQRATAVENYLMMREYLLDMSCRVTRINEIVAYGSKESPTFATPVTLIYGKECEDQTKPAPILRSGY
jgi:hypothetical protein